MKSGTDLLIICFRNTFNLVLWHDTRSKRRGGPVIEIENDSDGSDEEIIVDVHEDDAVLDPDYIDDLG